MYDWTVSKNAWKNLYGHANFAWKIWRGAYSNAYIFACALTFPVSLPGQMQANLIVWCPKTHGKTCRGMQMSHGKFDGGMLKRLLFRLRAYIFCKLARLGASKFPWTVPKNAWKNEGRLSIFAWKKMVGFMFQHMHFALPHTLFCLLQKLRRKHFRRAMDPMCAKPFCGMC